MSARSNRPRSAALGVTALYTLPALARASGVTQWTMGRLLRANGVVFVRTGRALKVPLSEIQRQVPLLWESILAVANHDHQRRQS